jgi:hypothetical protein
MELVWGEAWLDEEGLSVKKKGVAVLSEPV